MLKKPLVFICICLASFLIVPVSLAQEEGGMPPSMMEHMTPAVPHQMLAKLAGTWKAKMSIWMAPGAEPVESVGKSVQEMIMNGRFLRSNFEINMMGMAFTGLGFQGYDNSKKKYVSTWIDNMSTSLAYGEGTFDKENNLLVTTGRMESPEMGGEVDYRTTTQIIDDNKHVFTMYVGSGDQEKKAFVIDYTRE